MSRIVALNAMTGGPVGVLQLPRLEKLYGMPYY